MGAQLEGSNSRSNLREKLSNLVSGFRGYEDRTLRIESERFLRNFLEEKIENGRRELLHLCDGGYDADLVNGIRGLAEKLDDLLGMIRFPKYRHSSFFDVEKIGTRQIKQVYNMELELIGELALMEERIDNIKLYDKMITDQFNELFKMESQTIVIERKIGEKERFLKELG